MDKLLEAMQLATQAYDSVLEQEIESYELVSLITVKRNGRPSYPAIPR